MKKKVFIFSFLVLSIFCVFGLSKDIVNAESYSSWMEIGDDAEMWAKERKFSKGTNKINIDFSYWVSSICKKNTDTSYVTINLFDTKQNRSVAHKTLKSSVLYCSEANFGKQSSGYYQYAFMTYSKTSAYCGYHANHVNMMSN